METTTLRRAVAGSRGLGPACLLVLSLTGCDRRPPEVAPETGEAVAQVAGPAAAELLRTLVGRLTQALEEGGAAHAVEFCAIEAIPHTRMVESRLEGRLGLKRTSFRYRNPDNAPDAGDEAALRYFEEAILTQGSAPAHYVQRASETEYRYYQPLFVGQICLQCHGDPGEMGEDVQRAVRARYPEDLATGYEAGQLRGAVRVTVPADRVEG